MHKTLIAAMAALVIMAPAGAFAGSSTAEDAVNYTNAVDMRATASIDARSDCAEANAADCRLSEHKTFPAAPVTPQFGH